MHLYFIFLALTLFFSSCSSPRAHEDSMVLQIKSSKKTNRGTPLYIVVKETSMADFLMDDYHEIATQSFWTEENPSKLLKKVIVPGNTDRIDLPIENSKTSVGLYFIFTNPGKCWKYFIDDPQAKNVKVLLGDNEYEAINVYKS